MYNIILYYMYEYKYLKYKYTYLNLQQVGNGSSAKTINFIINDIWGKTHVIPIEKPLTTLKTELLKLIRTELETPQNIYVNNPNIYKDITIDNIALYCNDKELTDQDIFNDIPITTLKMRLKGIRTPTNPDVEIIGDQNPDSPLS